MKEYEVLAEEIRLDRRYKKGEQVSLTPAQARYLLLNGEIALKEPSKAKNRSKPKTENLLD